MGSTRPSCSTAVSSPYHRCEHCVSYNAVHVRACHAEAAARVTRRNNDAGYVSTMFLRVARLPDGSAAIHVEHLAADIARRRRAEKDGDTLQLAFLPQPAKR